MAKRLRKKIPLSNHPLIAEEGFQHESILIHRDGDFEHEIILTPDEAEQLADALSKIAKRVRKQIKAKAAKAVQEAKKLS